MTKDRKHTPLPFDWGLKNDKYSKDEILIFHPDGEDSEIICGYFMGTNGSANAEFIIRACNSHYELVELLKTARSLIINAEGNSFTDDERIFLDEADAAISKAEASNETSN